MSMNKREISNVAEIVIGLVLTLCGHFGVIDEYWSVMGTALVFIGFIMLLRQRRYKTNEEYKEKVDIEINDERNKYLRVKAWAWAGYLFVLLGAAGSIIFRILGNTAYSVFSGLAVCLLMLIYWISYLLLKRKY